MNFGIIGAGMIGAFHARAIEAMQNGTLVGVADRVPERAEAFAREHGTTAYASLDAMLADPAIEIVTIGTPSGAHFEPAMAAIADTKEAATEEKEVELKSDVRSLLGFKHHNPKKTLSSRPPGLAPPLDGLLARRRGRPLRVGGGLGAPFSGVHVWTACSYSRSQGTVI